MLLILLANSLIWRSGIFFPKTLSSGLSIFHVNIRSLNKNFEDLKDFLSGLKDKLRVIALTNTWFSDDKADKDFFLQIPNYTPVH